MDLLAFGNRLKSAREAARLDRDELRDLSGISISYIGDLERGIKEPGASRLYALARVLNTSMEWLVAGDAAIAARGQDSPTVTGSPPEQVHGSSDALSRCREECAELRGQVQALERVVERFTAGREEGKTGSSKISN